VSPTDPLPAILSQAQVNLSSILQARALHASRAAAVTGRLAAVAARADRLLAVLALLQDCPPLHTPAVRARAHDLMRLAADHASALMVMAADSMRGAREREREEEEQEPREEELRHLDAVQAWLEGSARELEGLVRSVYVGLAGDVKEGWWVETGELVEVAGKVREVLGCEMVLVENLRDRLREGTDEIIRLDDDNAAALGLPQTTIARIEQWRAGVS
ncbi:uncharacterized protein P884DRAFT_317783, partial [Thermothelomyces heterothallicus CBS 202.75]|uniref:uncharacterized protein n=1 Tax=Thermothelomyces heterothallicus CBS 202.75 TaxID=1149848 RepID=UPI0037421107